MALDRSLIYIKTTV